MAQGKHRRPTKRLSFRSLLGISVAALLGMGAFTACAAASPAKAPAPQEQAKTDWKPMAVPGLEYACDPTLGIIVKRQWIQNGVGAYRDMDNWVISVVPYSQTTAEQEVAMCGGQR